MINIIHTVIIGLCIFALRVWVGINIGIWGVNQELIERALKHYDWQTGDLIWKKEGL